MSDQIHRYHLVDAFLRQHPDGHFVQYDDHAAALAEKDATLARQQALLDRALEASFDDKARADRAEEEIARLREALADLEDEIDNSAIEFERPTFVEVCEGIIRAALTPKP